MVVQTVRRGKMLCAPPEQNDKLSAAFSNYAASDSIKKEGS